jgi:hypothetical protein
MQVGGRPLGNQLHGQKSEGHLPRLQAHLLPQTALHIEHLCGLFQIHDFLQGEHGSPSGI